MAQSAFRRTPRSGCLPLVLTCVVACALLILNSMLVTKYLGVILEGVPSWLRRPKVEQTLLFVLPVIATVIEWWVADWILFFVRERPGGGAEPDDGLK